MSDYIRPKRTQRQSRATVRIETEPGQQLQYDWGEIVTNICGKATKVYFSVNTLGWSRRFFVYSAPRKDAEHTFESLIQAMVWFDGVTGQVLVDKQKTAVIQNQGHRRVRYNSHFLDLAGHYGFVPKACRPRRAQTKGKTKRMVGYVKHNYFVRYRAFESLNHLNQMLAKWLTEEADQRVHGTLKEVVADRFSRKRDTLGASPSARFDTSYVENRHVACDGYVEVRGNRYSVPDSYCGKQIVVRISLDDQICLTDLNSEVIADHLQRPAIEGWSTVPAHHKNLWRQVLQVERRDLSVYEAVAAWN